MILSNHKNLSRSVILFVSVSIFTITLGILGILGWVLNIDAFLSVLPHYATMKFNTASCFIISGISFLLLIKYNSPLLRNLFRILAICLGAFAFISFSQNIFHWSAGMDQLFVTDYSSIKQGLPFPGRMSPSTSLCFGLLAISFLGIDSKSARFKLMAQYLLHIITLISFISITGFLLKVPYTLKFSFFSTMAINTGTGFFLLSVMASAINFNLGITSIFTGEGIGNIVARKLFPRMTVILIIIGYISIELQRAKYISTEFGVVVSTIVFLLISLFLIWNALMEMNSLDLKRIEAESELLLLNKNLESIIHQRTLDLEQSNDRFIKIFNASPTGVAITNLQNAQYTDVNPAIIELLQYTREELIGHTASELSIISPEYRQKMVDNITGEGSMRNVDAVLKDKYHNDKHCILSAELLETNNERYMMSFVYDITDRKIAQNGLQEAKKGLEVLTGKLTNQNKQLLSFAHIISHNLRSPVSNLNLLVHFYKESPTQEDKDELWVNFETVIGHLNTTLDDLLETLKIQEDTSKEREELNFEKIFHACTEMLIGQVRESGAIIKIDFSKAEHVIYPRIYLESIMLNLISNAIKYKSPKRTPEISVVTDIVNGETILTVQDNGLGIDLARHGKNLFGLRKTFHRHAEAKGLGLFITKTQIEAMGGEISAESVVDEGTTFKVIFNKKTI